MYVCTSQLTCTQTCILYHIQAHLCPYGQPYTSHDSVHYIQTHIYVCMYITTQYTTYIHHTAQCTTHKHTHICLYVHHNSVHHTQTHTCLYVHHTTQCTTHKHTYICLYVHHRAAHLQCTTRGPGVSSASLASCTILRKLRRGAASLGVP